MRWAMGKSGAQEWLVYRQTSAIFIVMDVLTKVARSGLPPELMHV